MLLSAMKRFVLDESGLETVEWAIVGGLIAVVGGLIFITIGQDVSRGIGSIQAVTGDIR
jgi:Flp pilus assembly pilin Flp